MSSLIAFLVTLGVLSVSDVPKMERAYTEPTAQVEQATPESGDRLDARRERIRITNTWLRSLRQVKAKAPTQKRTLLAAGGDPNA